MARIAPIRLQYNPKTLWFDPGNLEIAKGDAVVVKTARGIEYGCAAEDIQEVSEEQIKKLKSELKPVVRLATEDDKKHADEMHQKSLEALPIFKEMAFEASEDMHPVSVEFLLEGDKAVFYFEAEERIDFRELVRKLATHFKVRVDMRQIGVRDEARMIGGLGHCGQELCCKRLGGEFNPVSIRMAKEQDLSLNPQKISGVCGRLMCCLRYECDAYKDFKSRAPKVNAKIDTPDGIGKVTNLDVPREVITIAVPDKKPVKIPLSEMVATEEGERPNKVPKDVYKAHSETNILTEGTSGIAFDTSRLKGSEKLSDAQARPTRGEGDNHSEDKKSAGKKRRSRRRRSGSSDEAQNQEAKAGANNKQNGGEKRTPRKRKSSSSSQGTSSADKTSTQRPGQKSSGLRAVNRTEGNQKKPRSQEGKDSSSTKTRRSRRRSHKAGGTETKE